MTAASIVSICILELSSSHLKTLQTPAVMTMAPKTLATVSLFKPHFWFKCIVECAKVTSMHSSKVLHSSVCCILMIKFEVVESFGCPLFMYVSCGAPFWFLWMQSFHFVSCVYLIFVWCHHDYCFCLYSHSTWFIIHIAFTKLFSEYFWGYL